MKRWAAALGPLAVVCLLAACSSGITAGNSAASAGSFASQADQVVADLTAGNFTAVEAKFDPAMIKATQALPLDRDPAMTKATQALPWTASALPRSSPP
jgi:hypothetical protein